MAFARDVYTATASQTDFTITFPYQAEEDVTVTQNGSTVATDDYTFPNATTVRLDTGATLSDTIVLQRSTSQTARDVDFTAGPLTEADLDNALIQVFYMAQEAIDQAEITLGKDASELWDATSIRIINVADPTSDQDAATKAYTDAAIDAAVLGNLTTPISIANGGTAAATAAAARVSLGVPGVYTGATAPTTAEDTGTGYVVGDVWVDTTADKSYLSLDVSAEAAVWVELQEVANAVTLTGDNDWVGRQNMTAEVVTSSATPTFDFSASGGGNKKRMTMAHNITSVTLSNPGTGDGTFSITLERSGTLYAITGWPAAVKWRDGTAPNTTALTDGHYLHITLEWDDTDDIYIGSWFLTSA
jgi:hypothetical protein